MPVKGKFETIKIDRLVSAIGQAVNSQGLDLAAGKGGRITVDNTYKTNVDGVYAAGDAVSGPQTVVNAIAEARKAIAEISKSLGEDAAAADEKELRCETLAFDPACLEHSCATKQENKEVSQRKVYEEDIPQGLPLDAVKKEAARCFNCGCVAVCPSDLAPALISLDAEVVTNKRTMALEDLYTARLCGSTILGKDEVVLELRVPKQQAGNNQSYVKFRTRKSIDFPIAGLAANIVMEGGVIKKAAMVMSAVSPVPKRLAKAAEFLVGKKPDEEIARQAAAIAVSNTLVLQENSYKKNIAYALVRRTIAALQE